MSSMRKRYQAKRVLAMILAIAMVVTVAPVTAYAEEPDSAGTSVQSEPQSTQSGNTLDEEEETGDPGSQVAEEPGDPGTTPAEQSYKLDVSDVQTVYTYSGEEVYLEGTVKVLDKDGEVYQTVRCSDITKTWKQGDNTVKPVNAGSYTVKLTVTVEGKDVSADVDVTVESAEVTVTANDVTVKPGTPVEQVKAPEIFEVTDETYGVEKTDVVLTVKGIRDAVTAEPVAAGTKLSKRSDYMMDLTPAWAESVTAADLKRTNYKLPENVAVRVNVSTLITTRVTVTLAEKWQGKTEGGETTEGAVEFVYDNSEHELTSDDYTVKVEYQSTDETGKEVWAELEGATVEGAWYDEDGTKELEEAPVDAGTYTYRLTYSGDNGETYEENHADITVEILPATLTVEITNSKELEEVQNTSLQDVLNDVEYKVTDADGRDVTAAMKQQYVWGSSYDDSNTLQVYVPAFTLQVSEKKGPWKDLTDDDYCLQGGEDYEYRVIYNGQKAVYNANGSFAGRTGINDDSVMGYNANYTTDVTPTADDKALKVTVKAGEAVTVDAAALIGTDAGAGAADPLTAAAKTYDGKTLYGNRSAYKKAAVKKADGTSVSASSAELVYTWQSWNEYEYYIDGDYVKDRLDMQILSENIKNKFVTDVEEDFYKGEDCWNDIDYNPIPKDAGVYRLKITYTDKTEDGSYYFAKEPAYVYYVIEPEKIKITPTGDYNVLENRYLFAVSNEREGGITYEMKTVPAEGEGQIIDTDGLYLSVDWYVEETKTPQEGEASKPNDYDLDSYGDVYQYQIKDADGNTYAYKLYANDIESLDEEDEASVEFAANHTVNESKMADVPDSGAAEGPKKKERQDTLLSDKADIKVTPMGTAKIELAVDDTKWGTKSKVYDAKPFTLEDLVTDGLVTVNQVAEDGTKTPVAEDPKELLTWTVKDKDESYSYDEWSIDEVKDGGTYTLYASFPGNETYAPIEEDKRVGVYTITPRELTVTVTELPNVSGYVPATDGRTDGRAGYEAGVNAFNVTNNIANKNNSAVRFTVEGYAEEDAQYFQRVYARYDGVSYYGIPAWSSSYYYDEFGNPSFALHDKKDQKVEEYDSLERDSEYNIWYSGSLSSSFDTGLEDQEGKPICINFARNYKVAAKPVSDYFPTFKGNATVSTAEEWDAIDAVASRSTANNTTDSMSQSLELLEAVPYTNEIDLSDYGYNKKIEGNLVAVQITPPREFTTLNHNKMIYQNAIENAGGYVVEDPAFGDHFTAVFDANCDADPEFSICWDDGYVEKIVLKLKDAAKLGDLENAVMPKSLAFNAAPGKIAVGETVQLDVKITKKQMGDLVYLGYASTDEDVLSVTDTGLVTARKLGKATVTVYPLHKTAGGQTEKIPGSKEAKAVITVTAVTAPKPVKAVETHEDTVKLDYPKLADGYRREIYVVDNSKGSATEKTKKAADIEKLVVGLKNGSWKGVFAAKPIFLDSADEALNRSTSKEDDHPYTALVEGLAPNTSYTVYVRNVAALHTLNDVNILEEGASGTTVSVKTTKSEVTELEAELRAADGVELMGHERTEGSEAYDAPVYRIDLTKTKTAQVDVSGLFKAMAADSSADDDDETWKSLPLAKADKDYYEEPSLEYGWYEYVWNDKKKDGEYQFVQKNDYMSVDKKGKVKFTGVTGNGTWMKFEDGSDGCYLIVMDTKTGQTAYVGLHPDAQAQSVTAIKKSYTLDVGRGMGILNLLKYKMPGMTFTAYAKRNVAVTKEMMDLASAQGFTLSSSGYLTAVQPGASLELTLKDIGVAQAGYESTASATVTFKTSALQPVKALKAYDVTNNKFGLRFTHQGLPNAFLVEIRDGNGLVFSKSYSRGSRDIGWTTIYDKKHNPTDTYQYRITPNNLPTLTKETQYTVTVTAQYYNAGSSKAASTKVKTTKIPAVNTVIDEFDIFGNPLTYYDEVEKVRKPYVYYGGMSIAVSEGSSKTISRNPKNLDTSTMDLTVQSGSSYTLTAMVDNNRGRISDTLVWSVSDAKVATVKAAAGSYAITLKGVKPGTTTLEVKSKILGNKVVARYKINVVAVGDAYSTKPNNMKYNGDNEPEDYEAPNVPGSDVAKVESLPIGVDDNRKVTDRSEHIFTFTAPEDGQYTFSCTGGGYNVRLKKEGESYNYWYTASISLDWMAAGDTVKLYSKNGSTPYYVTVKQTVRLADNALTEGQDKVFTATSYEYAYMTFTAPEDGVYRFTAYQGDVENGEKSTSYLYTSLENMKSYSSDQSGQEIEHTFKAGETVYISVYMQPGYTYTVKTEKLSQPLTPDAPISIAAGKETYLQWTAEKDGVYEFTLSEAAAEAAMALDEIEITLTVGTATRTWTAVPSDSIQYEAKAGDPVVLKITNKKSDALTVKVSQPKAKEIEDLPATAKLPVGGGDIVYRYTAQTADEYEFTVTYPSSVGKDSFGIYVYGSYADYQNNNALANITTASLSGDDNQYVCTVKTPLEAETTVYIKLDNGTEKEVDAAISSKKLALALSDTPSELTLQTYDYSWVKFTAPADGTYQLKAASDESMTYSTLYGVYFYGYKNHVTGDEDWDECPSYSTLRKSVSLSKGETIFVKISNNYSSYEQTVYVSCSKSGGGYKVLKEGAPQTASWDAGKADVFLFEVPETGYYTFYADNNQGSGADNAGWLIKVDEADNSLLYGGDYDDYGPGVIAYDDQSGGNNNFKIETSLSEGQLVYLRVSDWLNNWDGSCTVHAERN